MCLFFLSRDKSRVREFICDFPRYSCKRQYAAGDNPENDNNCIGSPYPIHRHTPKAMSGVSVRLITTNERQTGEMGLTRRSRMILCLSLIHISEPTRPY